MRCLHLSDSQNGHSEDEGNGPGHHVEIGGFAGQWLVGGAQGFKGRVPGVGEHDKPNHTWHHGVVDDDEDGDARQRLWRSGEKRAACFVGNWCCSVQRPDWSVWDMCLRWLPETHCVVTLAHDLFAGTIQELGQPANAAHKEAGIDVEENDSGIPVGIFPVCKECGLQMKKMRKNRLYF